MKNYLELHLTELKYNFFIFLFSYIYLFLITYYFSNQLIYLFINIFINKYILKYFIFTNITDIFITKIFISFFITTFLSIQIFVLQFWFFISYGLLKYENIKFIKFYTLFFFFNLTIILNIIIKIISNIWYFFLNFDFNNIYLLNIHFEPNINNYFSFLLKTYLYFYIIFVYFFLFLIIILNNSLKIKTIITLRKFFYLKYILISIFLSPPDFVYQIMILLVFIFLFEILIFIQILLNRYLFNKV